MNSYIRDDGAVMVETRPGCFTRRDALGPLDLAPMPARRVAAAVAAPEVEPPPLAPGHDDLAREPAEPPPLQPSHEDLVSAAEATTGTEVFEACSREALAGIAAAVDLSYDELTTPWPTAPAAAAQRAAKPPRTPRPKPAKRPLAAILAEADRTHRARKAKA